MYAVIEDSGVQFKVAQGDVIEVDPRELPEGADKIEFDHVVMLGEGADAKIGRPYVEGAKVVATVYGQVAGEKIDVIKFRRRKGYRRKTGHRQKYLRVTIDEIVDEIVGA